MTAYKIIVLSNAVAGREAEFTAWYENRHLPDLLAIPGFASAQRFRILGSFTSGVDRQSLTECEIETDDLEATLGLLQSRLGTDALPMSEAFDADSVMFIVGEAVTGKLERGTLS